MQWTVIFKARAAEVFGKKGKQSTENKPFVWQQKRE